YGPKGSWVGGREKAPAAFCRKVAVAKLSGDPSIDIWGDGEQTRSFCYIDDCVLGLMKLMASDFHDPLNLGSDRMVNMNELVGIIAGIADTQVEIGHIEGPQGVRGRNSDNTLLRKVLRWEPEISLEKGLGITYRWIEALVRDTLDHAPDRKKAIEELRESRIYQAPCT
ncbi:MAG TPA: NAD-dependent epimerase/dehydratase family protein, partial [Methanomicrobiales archaeon]|nr:NAD-dependent epimerase/dehydratase family protein [Methanomicrobiales archaeon]